jgi:hypothetical protein
VLRRPPGYPHISPPTGRSRRERAAVVLGLGVWVRDKVLVRKGVRDCAGRAFGGGGLVCWRRGGDGMHLSD